MEGSENGVGSYKTLFSQDSIHNDGPVSLAEDTSPFRTPEMHGSSPFRTVLAMIRLLHPRDYLIIYVFLDILFSVLLF